MLESSYALGFARVTEIVTISDCLVTVAMKKEHCSIARSATLTTIGNSHPMKRSGALDASSVELSRTVDSRTSLLPIACSTPVMDWRWKVWMARKSKILPSRT